MTTKQSKPEASKASRLMCLIFGWILIIAGTAGVSYIVYRAVYGIVNTNSNYFAAALAMIIFGVAFLISGSKSCQWPPDQDPPRQ